MKYETVLFDLDGTLLDTTEGVVNAVRRTILENGFPMPDEAALKHFVGPPMQKSMEERFGLDMTAALQMANEFRANYKAYSLFQAVLYDGILPLLQELRGAGYKIAVATNKSHQNAMDILTRFGVMEYCDATRGSDLEGKLSKSDIIDICVQDLGCEKARTVLVGDSIFDLHGAERAGIDFIAVTYGFGFRKGDRITSDRCVFVADDVADLRRYMMES